MVGQHIPAPYVGRFAPSPSGALHFGSLVAAVASYAEARKHAGQWRIRIEDLDPPREQAGADKTILHTLEKFGFQWDGAIEYQSKRYTAYQAALDILTHSKTVYACNCSRQDIKLLGKQGIEGAIYPGLCRTGPRGNKTEHAIRMTAPNTELCFYDQNLGTIIQNPQHCFGDFVIKRADGLWAYQLAVVVDDAWQGITHVVRGADLLDSTTRQIALQKALALPTPHYCHIPVVTDTLGQKLSKQRFSTALGLQQMAQQLTQALQFLGQQPPQALATADLEAIWQWTEQNWQLKKVPTERAICFNKAS